MRYLDRFIKIVATELERELKRVSCISKHVKELCENENLKKLLMQIKTGEVTAPSNSFERFAQQLTPDDKYSSWASELFWHQNERELFSIAADLSNILVFKDDNEFRNYCHRISYKFEDGWPE